MNIEGTYKMEAPREAVFKALLDPAVLSKAIPGCEKLDHLGNNRYEMTITMGIAAVKGTYAGKVELEDIVPPESYKMTVDAAAFPGAVKGIVTIRLVEDGNLTRISYSSDLQVSGKIAAVGTRFLAMTAKMLTGIFFKAMAKEIAAKAG
ncbi:MAG: carbon monoxide dehydrogenase subunit G [Desulfobacterales bacterium]|nr:carbon monoxide dehydrogenase subunit G [Desulfobacterales bacterium]